MQKLRGGAVHVRIKLFIGWTIIQSRLIRKSSHIHHIPAPRQILYIFGVSTYSSNANRAPKPFQPNELVSIFILSFLWLLPLWVPFVLMYGNGLENSVRLFTLPFYSFWFRILNAIRVVAEKFGNLFLSHRPLHIYARNVGTISSKGNGRCGLQRML